MAYDSVTVTYATASNGWSVEPIITPSDAPKVGIYTNAKVKFLITNEEHTSREADFYIFDRAYPNHTQNYGSYTVKENEQFVVSEAFGSAAQAGRYMWIGIGGDTYADRSSILLLNPYTEAGEPKSPTLDETISRDAVRLAWGAGSAGTNNTVTGYDVQYQDSADGVSWPSAVTATSGWSTCSGSPVTGTSIDVSPPSTVGYYRRFRVRTRGSAGADWYSGWVLSTNTLRRKWNAFGAYTDQTLSVGGDLRAVHMTELQERVKTIRSFYGMGVPSFSTITGEVTLAADWADHVAEIRTAIDQITTNHAAWITTSAGEPAVAVMNQLREIINNI